MKRICNTCFGYSGDKGCRILRSTSFKSRVCPFHKTPDELRRSRIRTARRLERLFSSKTLSVYDFVNMTEEHFNMAMSCGKPV